MSLARSAKQTATHLKNAGWENILTNTLSNEKKAKIFQMYNTTYGNIGTRFKNINDIIGNYPDAWMYSVNQEPKAIILYWESNFGKKFGLSMCDSDSKAILLEKRHSLLKSKTDHYYSEMSHAPQHLALKAGDVPQITDPKIIQMVIEGSVMSNHTTSKNGHTIPRGSYCRIIEGVGAEPIHKTLWGNPKIPSSVFKGSIKGGRKKRRKTRKFRFY